MARKGITGEEIIFPRDKYATIHGRDEVADLAQ